MKKIAPVIVTIIMVSYLAFYLWLPFGITQKAEPFMGKAVLVAIFAGAVGMIVAVVYTLILRLKEIDKEDDNDLSKY